MKAECPDCPPAHHFSICISTFASSLQPLKTPMLVQKKRDWLYSEVKRLRVKSSAAGKTDFT